MVGLEISIRHNSRIKTGLRNFEIRTGPQKYGPCTMFGAWRHSTGNRHTTLFSIHPRGFNPQSRKSAQVDYSMAPKRTSSCHDELSIDAGPPRPLQDLMRNSLCSIVA
jgi:hypothetical protein